MKKQYTSYQQTIEQLYEAMQQHPSLIRVHSIGETWEKRPIIMVTLSLDISTADLRPAVLYTGTIHAREWIGIELANRFVKYVIDNYRTNPKLQRALSRNTFYMVPCLNPDGFEFSRTHFSFWRKNRRDNGDGSFGVDLNRNFGVRFKKRSDTNSTTYSGPAPFSEPETAAIRDFVAAHSNITLALDYHSQGNVFFPAHKFNHEAEADTTDLNTLCANMAWEIEKVTGRKYGIHRGKPPTNLINGSGREYYYQQGILSTVVEVGTRNIPDYIENMSESVEENIPALLYALDSAINYSHLAPVRVSDINVRSIDESSITLEWEYPDIADVYFEIYRSSGHKQPCTDATLVGCCKALEFVDVQLQSGQFYYYKIRAVNQLNNIKGPFAPELKLKTPLAANEFSRTLFPTKTNVGYVGQHTGEFNQSHFGHNSLFIGISKRRGICFGVIAFELDRLPEDIDIRRAVFSLYPMNRVMAKIEQYGEWRLSFLDGESVADVSDYQAIRDAKVLHTGQAVPSDRITQGVWHVWHFNGAEREIIRQQIAKGRLLIRVDGPDCLPRGADSQMMQFDIGYGKFGSGIHYRPNLELVYRKQPQVLTCQPCEINTIYPDEIRTQTLSAGYDEQGRKIYGQLAFDLADLPSPLETVITDAYLVLGNRNQPRSSEDIRYSVELAELHDVDYDSVVARSSIQYLGYELSAKDMRDRSIHYFSADSYARSELQRLHAENKPVYLVVRPTSANRAGQNELVNWEILSEAESSARLVVEYVERPREPLPAPTDLQAVLERNRVKITWRNASEQRLVGSFVVRNRFHPPKSPFDGVKLYGGADEYTYDNFGNPNIPKYYAVFSYDQVPMYSTPALIHFSTEETLVIEEVDPEEVELQDGDKPQSAGDDSMR